VKIRIGINYESVFLLPFYITIENKKIQIFVEIYYVASNLDFRGFEVF